MCQSFSLIPTSFDILCQTGKAIIFSPTAVVGKDKAIAVNEMADATSTVEKAARPRVEPAFLGGGHILATTRGRVTVDSGRSLMATGASAGE